MHGEKMDRRGTGHADFYWDRERLGAGRYFGYRS